VLGGAKWSKPPALAGPGLGVGLGCLLVNQTAGAKGLRLTSTWTGPTGVTVWSPLV
jgi:hypothetical protein